MTARPCPQQLRCTNLSRAESRRVDAYVQRVGVKHALAALGVGEWTLAEARSEGRMLTKTRAKILEALAHHERETK